MSHLLATVNPEASDAIRPDAGPLPGVGATVCFHCQVGYSRDGRQEMPALVTRVRHEDDTLDLIIFYDAGDFIDEIRVPRHSTANPYRAWSFPKEIVHRELVDRINEPGGLRTQIAALESAVFGDFDRPSISLMQIMETFESRIRDMQKQVREALSNVPAKAPRKKK